MNAEELTATAMRRSLQTLDTHEIERIARAFAAFAKAHLAAGRGDKAREYARDAATAADVYTASRDIETLFTRHGL